MLYFQRIQQVVSVLIVAVIALVSALALSGCDVSSSDSSCSDVDSRTLTYIANALGMKEYSESQIPHDILVNVCAKRNSNSSFAVRQTASFNQLINNRQTFNPDYSSLYNNLINYSSSINPQQALALDGFRAPDQSTGYLELPKVAFPSPLSFPESDGFDLTAQFGWYYAGGVALGENGQEYGIVYMLRTSPLLPPEQAAAFGLTANENQVSQMLLEINPADEKHFQARPIVVAGTTGLLEFGIDRIYSALGVNSFESLNPPNLYPLRIKGIGWDYSTDDAGVEMSIDLTFTSGSERLYNGTNGCLPCCGGIGTLYYSLPQLKIDPANSTITIGNETITMVSGTFWLDHQWGNIGSYNTEVMRAFSNTQPPPLAGWDWFAMNFDNGGSAMAFIAHDSKYSEFYGATGSTPPGVMFVPVNGKYVNPSGAVINTEGTLTVSEWKKGSSTPDPNIYHSSGVWYPFSWHLNIPTMPEGYQDLTLVSLIDLISILYSPIGAEYQEAPIIIYNKNGERIGSGLGESTGYADTSSVNMTNQLTLAGLPNTPSDFVVPAPSPELVETSQMYIMEPGNSALLAADLAACFISGLNRF
jgi:hypothetical protein